MIGMLWALEGFNDMAGGVYCVTLYYLGIDLTINFTVKVLPGRNQYIISFY